MKRDVADFWNLLWELALLGCAGFALLNVFAPAQDLPWKPLDLSRPIGAATAAKVSAFDLPRVAGDEEGADLRRQGQRAAPRVGGGERGVGAEEFVLGVRLDGLRAGVGFAAAAEQDGTS